MSLFSNYWLFYFRRVKKLIDSASNIALGGDTEEKQKYIEPTILADVTFKDAVMQEEVSNLLTGIHALAGTAMSSNRVYS